MTEEVIDINIKTPSTRLLSMENPNVKVPKQAIQQANNDQRNGYYSFLSNFPKLTGTFDTTLPPKHLPHHICTNDPPIYSTPRRLLSETLKQVQTEFNPMLGYKLASFHLQIQRGPVFCMWIKIRQARSPFW